LSDSFLEQAQFNAVDTLIDKMDRVGFEPTTSASFLSAAVLYLLSKGAAVERELNCSNPTCSILQTRRHNLFCFISSHTASLKPTIFLKEFAVAGLKLA
jgi:hypothetical protein